MLKRLFSLAIAALVGLISFAEDGSNLWLRYAEAKPDSPTLNIKTSGVKAIDPTIAIAKRELTDAGITGDVVLTVKKSKGLSADAYHISTADGRLSISSPSAVGVLYGVYDVIRTHNLGAEQTDRDESPAYMLRVLNHWDNLNGTVERGYAGNSIWQWDELPAVISPRYEQYARACASVGINAAVLNNVNASPKMLDTENLQKVKAIADILRPYGIKTYLSINFASPKALGGLPTADPIDADVVKWWAAKIKEIYDLIPDFGGFLVKANSEGEPGPGDYGRSHSQGANMLADAIKPYGGVIMWRAFVYNPASPDRANQAYEEFTPLDGEFRDNVIIQIKNGPVDFQPREPFSPLFGAMPQTQQMVEFQITQEYLGASNHLVYLAPLFKECLDSDTHRMEGTISDITATPHHGISAIAGVANIGDDTNWCGHHFAQANWYAFGRLAWDPALSSEQIAKEWIGQTFTTDSRFVEPVSDLMLASREAAVDYMMPIGLHHIFAGNHHYGPEPWYFPEGIRIDWTPLYYHKADKDAIGFDRTIATGSGNIGEYAEPLSSQLENDCPLELLLWFHRVGWEEKLPTGRTLWEEMCYRYDRGVGKARSFQQIWNGMEPYIDAERYADVEDKLKIQTHDAQWWKDACLMYFQSINGLKIPEGIEMPVYRLEDLKKVQIPLGLYGCPTRDMLP